MPPEYTTPKGGRSGLAKGEREGPGTIAQAFSSDF